MTTWTVQPKPLTRDRVHSRVHGLPPRSAHPPCARSSLGTICYTHPHSHPAPAIQHTYPNNTISISFLPSLVHTATACPGHSINGSALSQSGQTVRLLWVLLPCCNWHASNLSTHICVYVLHSAIISYMQADCLSRSSACTTVSCNRMPFQQWCF